MSLAEKGRPIKVVLAGPSGVGKTSLIDAYFGQLHGRDISPTVPPEFVATGVKLEGNRTVDLHIWNTAGQERFQSVSAMFYRNSDVAFVCFDTSVDCTVHHWVERVRSHAPTASSSSSPPSRTSYRTPKSRESSAEAAAYSPKRCKVILHDLSRHRAGRQGTLQGRSQMRR
jgi:GTPase SAR1 family protein